MYAIVDIAGQQFRVEKDQKLYVHRLEGEVGSKVDFDKVFLIDHNGKITVGTPVIEGAMVYASILDHLKGEKVLVFKKKRRKGYRKKNGHRQYLSQILIEEIIVTGAKARAIAKEDKKAEAKEVKKVPVKEVNPAPAKEVKPVAVKEVKSVPVKKVVKKAEVKSEAKKPAAKKPAAKTVTKAAAKPASAEKKAAVKKPAVKKSGK